MMSTMCSDVQTVDIETEATAPAQLPSLESFVTEFVLRRSFFALQRDSISAQRSFRREADERRVVPTASAFGDVGA